MTIRGHVANGVVVLPSATNLPEGTLVEVTPLKEQAGVAAASTILAAMQKLPKIPPEWVDELEEAISAGRRAPAKPFDFPDNAVEKGV